MPERALAVFNTSFSAAFDPSLMVSNSPVSTQLDATRRPKMHGILDITSRFVCIDRI
jgi:hypothetical protein